MYNIQVRRIYLHNAETVFGFHGESDEAQHISSGPHTHTQRLLIILYLYWFFPLGCQRENDSKLRILYIQSASTNTVAITGAYKRMTNGVRVRDENKGHSF
jgi:hypothetical protein